MVNVERQGKHQDGRIHEKNSDGKAAFKDWSRLGNILFNKKTRVDERDMFSNADSFADDGDDK